MIFLFTAGFLLVMSFSVELFAAHQRVQLALQLLRKRLVPRYTPRSSARNQGFVLIRQEVHMARDPGNDVVHLCYDRQQFRHVLAPLPAGRCLLRGTVLRRHEFPNNAGAQVNTIRSVSQPSPVRLSAPPRRAHSEGSY